jgi:hypothetical protein
VSRIRSECDADLSDLIVQMTRKLLGLPEEIHLYIRHTRDELRLVEQNIGTLLSVMHECGEADT